VKIADAAKLPSNRLVKWQFKVPGMFMFFPEGINPNDDQELKRFGPWNLVHNSKDAINAV